MRQGSHETATSFISCWRENIIQMIHQGETTNQHYHEEFTTSYARHLMEVSIMDYKAVLQALYGIEDGITHGLWSDSLSSDSKGNKLSGSYRLREVGAIGSFRQRPPRP